MWEEKEHAAYEKLMPDHPVTDMLGRAWAYPATLVGAAIGSANVLAARIAGRKDARITVGNNALQFESGLIGNTKNKSAFTLGNSVLYGPGAHPETKSERRYDGRKTQVTLGEHEEGHIYQYNNPLLLHRYLAGRIAKAFTGQQNPVEVEADDFADEAYRRRRR